MLAAAALEMVVAATALEEAVLPVVAALEAPQVVVALEAVLAAADLPDRACAGCWAALVPKTEAARLEVGAAQTLAVRKRC